MTQLAAPLPVRRRLRLIVVGLVIVALLAVGAVLVERHYAKVHVGIGLSLVEEGQDWMRTTATTCAGINGAQPIGAGTLVEFVNERGELRGSLTLAELRLHRDTPASCFSPQASVTLSRLDDVLEVRIAGLTSGQITRAQVEDAIAPDVYPGLSIFVSECASRCRIRSER